MNIIAVCILAAYIVDGFHHAPLLSECGVGRLYEAV